METSCLESGGSLRSLAGLAWGDNPAPAARDAYVQKHGESTRVRSARLNASKQNRNAPVDEDQAWIGSSGTYLGFKLQAK